MNRNRIFPIQNQQSPNRKKVFSAKIVELRIKQISDEILHLRQMKKRAELDAQQDMGRENKAREIMELIFAEDLNLTEYSNTLVVDRVIERVPVLSKEEIRIHFVGGF